MKNFYKKVFGNIFSAEQLNGNLLANFFGLQVLRYLIAKFLYNLKFISSSSFNDRLMKKDGYRIIENFLNIDDFEKLNLEYHKAINDPKYSFKYLEYGEGVNATHVKIDNDLKNAYPNLGALLNNNNLLSLFQKNELKKKINIVANIERIKLVSKTKKDKVKTFHYDTYFNTFKAWLYMNDVELDNGPLEIMEKSHKFSFKRMFNEWITSLSYSLSRDKKTWFGYGLITQDQGKISKQSKKMIVKKNTLVFVNTHGLHRRGDAKLNSVRESVHFYTRENPFKLFF